MSKSKLDSYSSKAKGSFIIWLGSVIIFFLQTYFFVPETGVFTDAQANIFLVVVAVGMLSFLSFSFYSTKTTKEQSKLEGNEITFLRLILNQFLLLGILILIVFVSAIWIASENKNNSKSNLISFPKPTGVTQINELVQQSPTPVINSNNYTNEINSDPVIECQNPNCGSIRIKKSLCSDTVGYVCCQIGNNWTWYSSRAQCAQDQKNSAPQNNTGQQNNVQKSGNNFYCWNNAYSYSYYTSSGDQCNLDNLKSTSYKTCMDTQMIKSNSCKQTCKFNSDQDSNACAWAYTGNYPGIEQNTEKYGECLNGPGGVSDTYAACLAKCTDQYSSDIQQCK